MYYSCSQIAVEETILCLVPLVVASRLSQPTIHMFNVIVQHFTLSVLLTSRKLWLNWRRLSEKRLNTLDLNTPTPEMNTLEELLEKVPVYLKIEKSCFWATSSIKSRMIPKFNQQNSVLCGLTYSQCFNKIGAMVLELLSCHKEILTLYVKHVSPDINTWINVRRNLEQRQKVRSEGSIQITVS